MGVHPPLSELGFSEEAMMQSAFLRNPYEISQQNSEGLIEEQEQNVNSEGDTLFELRTIEQQIPSEHSKQLLAYDLDLDAQYAMKMHLQQIQNERANPEQALRINRQLESEKRQELMFNQQVYVMERHKAPIGKSRKHALKYNPEIQDYDLYADGTDISILSLIDRGIDYREGQGSTDDNIRENGKRERAERDGMEFTRDLFRDKKTSIGTKVFSFSPPSGDYKNNFFDGFELREDKDGNRYVHMQRYATSLTPEDYQELIPRLTDGRSQYDHQPTPIELLSHPVVLPSGKFESLGDVRNFLHEEKQIEFTNGWVIDRTLNDEDVIEAMNRYIDVLFKEPANSPRYKAAFRSMINITDAVVYREKYGDYETERVRELFSMPFGVAAVEFEHVSSRHIVSDCGDGFGAEDAGGFGFGSGLQAPNWSPFSVAEFGYPDGIKKWSYDKSGTCRGPKCRIKNFPDGGLGPCLVCRECEPTIPMLSESQLAALKSKESGVKVDKAYEKAKSKNGEKQKSSSEKLLASIKQNIPAEKPKEEPTIAIPKEEVQSTGWKIDLFGLNNQLTEEEQKKSNNKMKIYNYAMEEGDNKKEIS